MPANDADDSHDVVVYTTPFCAPCEALKRHLAARGIDYRVRDLMMDEQAQDRLEAANVRSTPALEIDGEIFAGDALVPDRLDDLLARHLA